MEPTVTVVYVPVEIVQSFIHATRSQDTVQMDAPLGGNGKIPYVTQVRNLLIIN